MLAMPVPGSEFVYNARGVIDTGYDFHGDDLTLSFCYAFGQDWHLLSVSTTFLPTEIGTYIHFELMI